MVKKKRRDIYTDFVLYSFPFRLFYVRLFNMLPFAVISKSGAGQLDLLILDTLYKVCWDIFLSTSLHIFLGRFLRVSCIFHFTTELELFIGL